MKIKILLFFLLFSALFYGQNDTIAAAKTSNIAVISADKMNVVYRGLPNPISISVPNCKSFEATGVGVYKVEERYQIVPGPGLESIIKLEIILLDGTVKTEEHKFRIKNLSNISGTINGLSCKQSIIEMSREELNTAVISTDTHLDIYGLQFKDKVISFSVEFPKGKRVYVFDNKLNDEALKIIRKLSIGSIFEINDIKLPNPNNICLKPVDVIKIILVKDSETKEE